MDKNMNTPPTGENEAEKIKKQRFVDNFKSYGFTDEEAETFINSNKDDIERQHYVDILESKPHPIDTFKRNISEFEANLIIDLSWDKLENRKWLDKKEVIEEIKKNLSGLRLRSYTLELTYRWKIEQETLAFIENKNTSKANILLAMEMVEFYIITGDIEEAHKCLGEIRDQLDMDGSLTEDELSGLYEKLFKTMDESGYPKDVKPE